MTGNKLYHDKTMKSGKWKAGGVSVLDIQITENEARLTGGKRRENSLRQSDEEFFHARFIDYLQYNFYSLPCRVPDGLLPELLGHFVLLTYPR